MRRLLSVLAALLIALPAAAGTVSRGTKTTSGTTSFADGTTIEASEVNTDFDNIYNEFNGNIDSDNISTQGISGEDLEDAIELRASPGDGDGPGADDLSANIEELTDHCDGENATTTCDKDPDRGSGTPTGVATNAGQEILMLRKALRRHAVGESCVLQDGDTSSDQFKYCTWFDEPIVSGNLLYNGDFESIETGICGESDCTDAMDNDGDGNTDETYSMPWGWTQVNPSGAEATYSLTATDVSEGQGNELRIEATDAEAEGVSQTLAGLKASTKYLVTASILSQTGTNCTIVTTGADSGTDFDDLDLDSSSLSYVTKSGIIQTDSTPTDIVVQLVTAASASADCAFDHAGVYELGIDPPGRPTHLRVQATSNDTSALSTSFAAIQDSSGSSDLQVELTVPQPGCTIRVSGILVATAPTAASPDGVVAQFDENGTNVGPIVGWHRGSSAGGTADIVSVPLDYVNATPTVGTTYTYKIEADANSTSWAQGGSKNGHTLSSSIVAEMNCE